MKHIIRLLLSVHLLTNLGWSQISDTSAISFAWLTDIHVGSTTGEADLRSVVRDIASERLVQFAIISGDISELDTDQSLHIAKRLLDSMNVPYHIIPGNHDTKWSSSGGQNFQQLWGEDRFNVEYGDFRFIGLHQGPIMRMGNGYIDPADLKWIKTSLKNLTDPNQKIFIIMHYPMNQSVDNWYALRDLLRPYNIQAILHGHGHRNKVQSFEGFPGIMSRSTLGRRQLGSGYSMVKLYDTRAEFFERNVAPPSLELWHTLPLDHQVQNRTQVYQYPDYSENDSSGVSIDWQIQTGSIISSAPIHYKNRIYVTNTAGNVIALNFKNGDEVWRWSGKQAIHSTPAIKGSRLVFGGVDSNITCLSSKTGKLLWDVSTNSPVLGSPTIDKNQVYIGSGSGVLRSLNLKKGSLNWAYSDIDGYIETKPLISDGQVMFGAWDGSFYALDKTKGSLTWKWSGGRSGPLYSPAACWPVASHNKVFIVAPDRAMTAINIDNGETVWRKTGHQVRETIGISEDGTTIYARTMRDSVLAIHASSSTFDLKWNVAVGFEYDFAPSSIIEKAGRLFFGTKDGRVYCLDSSSGEVIWHHRVSDGLVNTPLAVDKHSLIVTAADGMVSLLRF